MKPTYLLSTASACAAALLLAACQSTSGGATPTGYHRVERGENLYRIGLRYNQSVATLSKWNNLSNPSQIEVGQLIRVSRNASTTAAKSSAQSSAKSSKSASSSKPSGAWSAPATAANIGNVRLQRPTRGAVISPFNGGSNKGIDFGGNRGDAVNAAGAGKIVYVGDGLRGYGNVIMLQHNQSLLTVYAHNEQILVREGEQVKAGQKIATMGSSGTDRVKLHFEVRQNGKAANPSAYW